MTEKEKRSICDTNRDAYKQWTAITLRYGDTDRQGHINNAVYCTLYESGRCDFLFNGKESAAGPNTSYVIARIALDYLNEMHYPGVVEVGTKIISTGRSSFVVGQAIFLNGLCCSTAESVIVLLDESTGKPTPITPPLQVALDKLR